MTGDQRTWNARVVAEFRANGGVVAWSTDRDLAAGRPVPPRLPGFAADEPVPLLLLTHTGAATGRSRVTPLLYLRVDDRFAVFATFGGSPRPPAWFGNAVATPQVLIEVGSGRTAATARVAQDVERDELWQAQVQRVPAFADFQATAGRQIPVLVLDPRTDARTAGAGSDDAGPGAAERRRHPPGRSAPCADDAVTAPDGGAGTG